MVNNLQSPLHPPPSNFYIADASAVGYLLKLVQLFPAIAQLEERGTVVETQKSLGRWFDSGSRENFFVFVFLTF